MAKAGIFTEDDRLEQLDGEIVQMAAIGKRHAYSVLKLNGFFAAGLLGRAVVSTQNPLALAETSEPQPDLMLLVPPVARYRDKLPRPSDVLRLIEVADTSASFERLASRPRRILQEQIGVFVEW